MIAYEKLTKKPHAFKSIVGTTLEEFDELYQKVIPLWIEAEEKRLDRPDRQRVIGGGRKYRLELRERVLMTVVWLRLYLSTEALGFFFDVDKATVSRNTRRILPILRQLGDASLGWPEPPKRGEGKSVEQALRDYPDLLAIVDATEQAVRRPTDNDKQKAHYSGKKKRHTRKVQITVNERGEIRDVSPSTPGAVHDLEHFRQSGVAKRVPKKVTVGGDAGYQGLHQELPDHSVFVPHKARRNHPLTEDEKLANRELSSIRIVVENTLAELKHFRVLADRFRHATEQYDDVFRSVVAIVNPRISRRVALAAA
jgi:IS5 family transposase